MLNSPVCSSLDSPFVIPLISRSVRAVPGFPYVMFEMSGSHELFYLVSQGIAFVSRVAVVAVVVAVLA